MKFPTDIIPTSLDSPGANQVWLPQGLIGFSGYTRGELLYLPDRLPFLWLKLHGESDQVHFIVIEPGAIVPDYEPELFDIDAERLGLSDPSEALILNIVTLRRQEPLEATVNLVGPIVVNRGTRVGRQLVVSNYARYSAQHRFTDNAPAPEMARIA